MALGKRLQQAREARKLTQEQLAAMVPGSSQASLSALESRDSKTTTLLFGIAAALQISPQWLQDGTGHSGLDSARMERDLMLEQLLKLYSELTPSARDKLVTYANGLHAGEHPDPSPANPYGKHPIPRERVRR